MDISKISGERFPFTKDAQDRDLAHFLDDGAKLKKKKKSEIKPPNFICRNIT